jgi:hypothetical protein
MLYKHHAKSFVILGLNLLIFSGWAQAENQAITAMRIKEPAPQEVSVRIRAIRASVPNSIDKDELKPLSIDKKLDDISTKLSGFDFRRFKLISEQVLTVPVKKKTVVNLTEKTVLNIRPTYVEPNKLGLWIKWTDSSGQRTLLDTRMHFDSQENMLAGTNCENNKALILSIGAVPK